MNPRGYLHIIIAIIFILYVVFEIREFYQSKPHHYRDRNHLIETEFPRLMNQIVDGLPKPDRQWKINRQGGAVALHYYCYNTNEHITQTLQKNIQNNACQLTKHGVNENLYCKEDIALTVGDRVTPENTPYTYLGISWQSRHSECKHHHTPNAQ